MVCDIIGRGWCIPSGRVEPLEESLEAVKREALEEGGAVLGDVQYIGCYQIMERNEIRWADCYAASVLDLVDIQVVEESSGRKFVTIEELATCYHVWNELTEKVFIHSRDVVDRLNRHRPS